MRSGVRAENTKEDFWLLLLLLSTQWANNHYCTSSGNPHSLRPLLCGNVPVHPSSSDSPLPIFAIPAAQQTKLHHHSLLVTDPPCKLPRKRYYLKKDDLPKQVPHPPSGLLKQPSYSQPPVELDSNSLFWPIPSSPARHHA
jgi:hypothetical protein